MDEIICCPECGWCECFPVTDPDDDGLCEYRCSECGHYFVAEA